MNDYLIIAIILTTTKEISLSSHNMHWKSNEPIITRRKRRKIRLSKSLLILIG